MDGQGIVPSGFFGGGGGPFPFVVTLLQSTIVAGNNVTFPVPFTATQLGNGIWQVTCRPTRFLPVTGTLNLRDDISSISFLPSFSFLDVILSMTNGK